MFYRYPEIVVLCVFMVAAIDYDLIARGGDPGRKAVNTFRRFTVQADLPVIKSILASYYDRRQVRHNDICAGFQALFFMRISIPKDQVLANIRRIWQDPDVGRIFRIKGFLIDDPDRETWIEVNATAGGTRVTPIPRGQEILIVIGEDLDEEAVDAYFPARFSTTHVR